MAINLDSLPSPSFKRSMTERGKVSRNGCLREKRLVFLRRSGVRLSQLPGHPRGPREFRKADSRLFLDLPNPRKMARHKVSGERRENEFK